MKLNPAIVTLFFPGVALRCRRVDEFSLLQDCYCFANFSRSRDEDQFVPQVQVKGEFGFEWTDIKFGCAREVPIQPSIL